MDINYVINNLIELPKKFWSAKNASIYKLLEDTGYFESSDQIEENDILEALIQKPGFINEWFIWSENKRSSSGWYIRKDDNDKYIVGYFSPQKINTSKNEYSDVKTACARFIKMEIEDIKSSK